MKSSLYKLLVVFTAFMSGSVVVSGSALANEWQALLVPDLQDRSTQLSVSESINDKLVDSFTRHQVALVYPSALSLNCELANCGEDSLMSLSTRILKTHADINLLVVYKLRQEIAQTKNQLILRIKAVDPVSGVVIFSTEITEGLEKEASTVAVRDVSVALASTLGERFAATIARSAKRYTYKVSMNEFTPEESRVMSSLLLPSAANISATLLKEETQDHFLGFLLPTKNISFRVTSPLTPAKFRQQAAGLVQRLGLQVNIRFIQQESLFELRRAQPAYLWQNTVLWLVSIAILYLVLLSLLRFWVASKLFRYERSNECGRWLKLLATVQKVPLPFLVNKSWKSKISHFEKRVEQSRMWFDNATNLLQNNEVESANVFVKRALEQNASNISARALENAISEQQSKHQEIKDEREQWKELVSSAVSFAKQNNTFLALEKAYTALELCKSHEKYNRPVIDLQIDSISRLIERISANKSALCEGLVISAKNQQLIINASSQMHIGRPNKASALNHDLQVQLPQSNLSRLGQSAAIKRQDTGHFSLIDIGTANGVWLQYNNIDIEQDYVLKEMHQIHLLPPDDLGTIALQVAFVSGNSCLALRLSQNAMLPHGSKVGAVGFLNPSIYEHTLWYMSREVFILVKREHDCVWFSESQWAQYQDEMNKREEISQMLPVASLQLDGGVYLDRLDGNSEKTFVLKVNGAELKGKVPIMDNVTVQVDDYVATLTLYPLSESLSAAIDVDNKSDREQFKK